MGVRAMGSKKVKLKLIISYHISLQDSSVGLVSPDEVNLGQSVRNYIKLFENLENCVQGNFATKIYGNLLTIVLPIITTIFVILSN